MRNQPRISVNKLGEYMIASPRRRRSIIEDQKEPSDFIVARYREASDAIAQYLASGTNDRSILVGGMQRIQRKITTTSTPTARQNAELSIEAIEAFMAVADDFDLRQVMRLGNNMAPPLEVAGVNISVRPEVLITAGGQPSSPLGAIKLCFGKTNALGDQAGQYVATVLHQYLEHSGTSNRQLCIVVDVFDKQMYTAPRAVRARRADIQAACEEIARAWSDV